MRGLVGARGRARAQLARGSGGSRARAARTVESRPPLFQVAVFNSDPLGAFNEEPFSRRHHHHRPQADDGDKLRGQYAHCHMNDTSMIDEWRVSDDTSLASSVCARKPRKGV